MKVLKTQLGDWVDIDYACFRESKDAWKDPFYGYVEMNRNLHIVLFGGSLRPLGEIFFQQYQVEDILSLPNHKIKHLIDQFLLSIKDLGAFI